MAYSDPYYREQQYPPAQQYDEFNPYTNARQPHQTYEQGSYSSDNVGGYNGEGYMDDPLGGTKERPPVFESEADDAIPNRPIGPRTSRNMRRWRYENSGELWTRGGGARTCGRFLCCTLMIFVFLLLSIVFSLVLWVRPPSVTIGNVGLLDNGTSPVSVSGDTLKVMLDINATVNNPNYFSVDLTELQIDLFYPTSGASTPVGNGEAPNTDFRSRAQTNVTLDATLEYNVSSSNNIAVLLDLAQKCGIVPGTSPSDITIDYTVYVGVKVMLVPVHVHFNSSFQFACPLSSDDIGSLLGDAGINSSDLGSLINGLGSLL